MTATAISKIHSSTHYHLVWYSKRIKFTVEQANRCEQMNWQNSQWNTSPWASMTQPMWTKQTWKQQLSEAMWSLVPTACHNVHSIQCSNYSHCCCLKKICPAAFRETCQWLKFPLNGLWAQSSVSPVVGLLPIASGPACLGMTFPPFLVKQLYHCDWVIISSFVRTGYTTRRWGWLG